MKLKSFGLAFALIALTQAAAQAAGNFDFNEHRVARVYKGRLQLPDFNGRDNGFADFNTRITEAMKGGVTFAGEFSVVQFGCGSGCSVVIIGNNRTGQLFNFPRGGENNQALTIEFKPDSNLMLVRWATDPSWKTCIFEALVFDDGKWIAKDALAGQGDEVCNDEIVQGLKTARGL